MKKGWEEKFLVKEFSLKSGDNLPAKKQVEGPYPVYGGNGIAGYHNEYNITGDNILIGRVGALCGNIHHTNGKVWVTDNAFVVNKIATYWDINFLTLELRYLKLNQYASQTAQPVISNKSMKDVRLFLPPLSEQKEIVEYLDSSFAKIDKLKENAAKNLEEAKALFQSALKDALEPKEGWEEKTLPDISENLDSRRIPITKGKRDSGKYPYYGASGIVDYVGDYIFDEDILLLSEDGANLLARSTPIAFSVSGKVWVNNHAHILKFKDMCTQRFVEYFFASKDISEYVTGAAQPKLSQKKMNIIPISIPSLSEQQSIVSFLDSLNEKVNTLQQNYSRICDECDALKQAILRQVFE